MDPLPSNQWLSEQGDQRSAILPLGLTPTSASVWALSALSGGIKLHSPPGGKAADDLIFFVDLPSPDLSPDLLGDYLPNTGLELEYCLRLHFWEGAQSKTVVIFHFLSPCRI